MIFNDLDRVGMNKRVRGGMEDGQDQILQFVVVFRLCRPHAARGPLE